MDSNQGAKDSAQDSKCAELDSHARQLSPMADWGHAGLGPLSLVQPDPNSTPTVGNALQLSPPSDTTVGNDPSFPSVINDVSSIGKANHCLLSKLNPSNAHDVAATNIAATNKNDDVSSIGNRLRLSAQSVIHSLAASMKDSLLHPFQHCQGSATSSSVHNRINSVICGGIPCNPPSQVLFAQPTVVHHFNPCGTPGNDTASTADTTHVPATPRCTVDHPSFPTCCQWLNSKGLNQRVLGPNNTTAYHSGEMH